MKTIILTGGGSAGHVTPNISLISKLRGLGYEIHYIGTNEGIERQIIGRENIAYHAIPAGKLRRYFDLKNFTDIFKIMSGFLKAFFIIRKVKPSVVFSKGGFVSCPVVWAAWLNRIPVMIHESDMTPGLANRLCAPFAKKICHAFPETARYLPADKSVWTGIPVRPGFQNASAEAGRKFCGFDSKKPVILVIGGSLGSEVLNKTVHDSIDKILEFFYVCHICGKNAADKSYDRSGYRQFEYLNEEIIDIFAMSDVVVSRAGATTLFEILELKKPNVLIPLSLKASRGDQILNANSFKAQGYSEVIEEEKLDCASLCAAINKLYAEKESYIKAMSDRKTKDAVTEIVDKINEIAI